MTSNGFSGVTHEPRRWDDQDNNNNNSNAIPFVDSSEITCNFLHYFLWSYGMSLRMGTGDFLKNVIPLTKKHRDNHQSPDNYYFIASPLGQPVSNLSCNFILETDDLITTFHLHRCPSIQCSGGRGSQSTPSLLSQPLINHSSQDETQIYGASVFHAAAGCQTPTIYLPNGHPHHSITHRTHHPTQRRIESRLIIILTLFYYEDVYQQSPIITDRIKRTNHWQFFWAVSPLMNERFD